MIDRTHPLPVMRQCQLLKLARSTAYYQPTPVSETTPGLMQRIDELHLQYPFAGARMLRDLLRQEGHAIGRRQVATLMRRMGIAETVQPTGATSFGRFQVDRQVSGGIQGHLNLTIAEDILVPELPGTAQSEIAEFVRSGLNGVAEVKAIYVCAQRILEEELGLDVIDLSHQVGTETFTSNVFHTRRWDSEFYKPKYRRVLDGVLEAKKVKVEKFVPVGQILSYLTNGHTPLHHDLAVGEVAFMTAEHVSDFRLDFGTDKRILRRHHETELARTALRDGDILVTIKGKVGNCAVVRDCPKAANINQDVALIRLREGIHPYFFSAWFNSLMGKQLVEQRSTGGINPFLGLGNLQGMPFPVIAQKEQNRIGDLVKETIEKAYAAEREATNLLEQAKHRVEELIEQDGIA